MSINLDFEVCALIMQIFFYFLFGFQYGKKSRDCIYYKRMLIMLFLATFSNLLANIYLNFPHKDYFVLFLLLSSFSFAGEIITLYYFYKYVLVLLPPAGKSRFESFNRVLAAAQGILCLLNPITGLIVRYDSEYKIIPGVLLFELYLVSAYFLILTFIKLCRIYKKLSRPQRIAVTSFVIIIVAGYVLQFLLGSMIQVKNFALTIGIIILLYSIETPDYEKMIIAQNELMQREKELQMAKDELDNQTKVVHQMTKTAFWQVGFGSDNKPAKYECSREALYMLGYSASEYKEDQFKELCLDAVHPDDKEAAKEAFLQGMDKENLHHEFRMRDKRGEYHWFLGTGTCIYGSSGNRISYRGVIRNIDDEKTREILSQERLHALEALEKSQVELKSALMRAEEASRAKTVFLSNMSHDIRTPMNAIVGFTNLALDHLDEQEEVRDCLFTIKNSGKHLLNLINDILDMSRIESGKVAIKPLRGDLLKIINEIREMMQTGANEKSQALIENHDGIKNRYVMIDRLRFNQVVINCLSNAIKFTPSKGTISFVG